LTDAEGNTGGGDRGESPPARAQSETPHMHGRLLHGNREAPAASGVDGMPERAGKAEGRTPVMDAAGESDVVIVPEKPPNKPAPAGTEVVEGRTATEGNADQCATPRTQSRAGVSIGLEGVRAAARRDRKQRFTALLHHIDCGLLRDSFFALKKLSAPGVDGVTWMAYEDGLEGRITDLHRRVHTGAYRALPSKRAYIPKADGQQRPLGIAALEDKIVQCAMVWVLNAIYEEDFAGFSYGFRPGRGQHDCLDALATVLMRKRVNWVLDADIRRFFDTIDHGWLMKFLEHRIADPRILRLIQKWLTAGVMEDGTWTKTTQGTPQGAVISPLLANVFLHYAFDWWAKHWRKTVARGEVYLVRYADDVVVCFERKEDGERFLAELADRLRSFGLGLHPDKTRLIEFGRFAACTRRRRGEGQPETFNFLGFTHYCGKTKAGRPIIWRKTIAKRMAAKVKDVKATLKQRRHDPIPALGAWLKAVVAGYFNYHAIPGNRTCMGAFHREICKAWLHALRRRSQRTRMTWQRFRELIHRWIPKPETKHPYPWARFDATHPM
jgi:RNA-directed DNA polymerase